MRRLLPLILILALLAGCKPADNSLDGVSPSPDAVVTPDTSPDASPKATPTPTPTPTPSPEPTPTPEPEPITATLTVAGDVMSHLSVIYGAEKDENGEYDFHKMMEAAKPWVESADLAVANLETTFSGGPDYSGFPAFNGPDSMGEALKDTGFDLLCTTNNHSLDRGYTGLCRTLDVLDEQGLAHVGTYRTQEERDENHGIVVADCGGISIAFLAYSYGTNGKQVPEGKEWCINLFNSDYLSTLSTPNMALLESDMAAAQELGCDLIAVIMHWGVEYQTTPNSYQKRMARTMVDLGADLVLGGHPHVLQPYEFITTEAGNSGFVCYSLGNFISNQDFDDTNSTVLLNLELKKDLVTGETTVESAGYIPFFMVNPGSNFLNKPVILLDTYAAIDSYQNGELDLTGGKSYRDLNVDKIHAQLQNSLSVCQTILGTAGDLQLEITYEPDPATEKSTSGTE